MNVPIWKAHRGGAAKRQGKNVAAVSRRWSRPRPCEPSAPEFVAGSDLAAFIAGMATVIDIGGRARVRVRPCKEPDADIHALARDWLAVGDDFRVAMGRLQRELLAHGDPKQETLFDANQLAEER